MGLPMLLVIIVLMIVGCSGNGKHLNGQGSLGHGASNSDGVFMFTLKNGQKGQFVINEKLYTFELLRINSQNNVTLVLQNGKKFHLQKKSPQSVRLTAGRVPVDFELDRVIQDAAIIHVRKPLPAIADSAVKRTGTTDGDVSGTSFQKQPETEQIRLNVVIVQDTIVKLSLDDQALKEIPLPRGTEVGWQAETRVDIELPEPHKARLEINGTCYKSSSDVAGLHLFVTLEAGKLTVEYR